MTPQQFLSDHNISFTSITRAITTLNNQDYELSYYTEKLKDLTGEDFSFSDQRVAKFTFLYFIQNYLRMFNNIDTTLTLESIIENCHTQAQEFIDRHPWLWATSDEELDEDDPNYTTSRKRGWKMDKAEELYQANQRKTKKEILAIFEKRLETSHAGAMSYFTKCSKKFGDCADSDSQSNVNKKTIALEVYKSNIDKAKDEIINILIEKLETTKSGAQTYFYTCKKELGDCAPSEKTKKKRKTKLNQAKEIYDDNPNLSKDELVELFIEKLQTTPAGANTYYHNVIIKEKK